MTDTATLDSPILTQCYRLREHLGIDMMALEEAFMTTPTILQSAGELVAEADQAENIAKHELEVAKAEASERIRQIPADQRWSEARIASMIPLDRDVRTAQRLFDTARFEAQICETLYKSLDVQS